MDSLRVSLIIIGAIILVLLYFGSRFWQERKNSAESNQRNEPSFAEQSESIEDEWQVIPIKREQSQSVAESAGEQVTAVESKTVSEPVKAPVPEAIPEVETHHSRDAEMAATEAEPAEAPAENVAPASLPEVIALHVVAGEDRFKGTDLVRAANLAAMRYGEMEIFHFQGVTKGDITFSMANMLEPGTFDMDQLEAFTTPGVLLFMESRYQTDIGRSLDSMARVAQRLCEVLGGELRDARRQPMKLSGLDEWKAQLLGN